MEINELPNYEQIEVKAKSQWTELVNASGGDESAAASTLDILKKAYSEPQRHYHNLLHILNVLKVLEEAREQVKNPITLSFAAWFHDAVYDPRASDNEEKSADLAVIELGRLGINSEIIANVRRLIFETKTHEVGKDDNDSKFFMDADMAILGADQESYDKYTRNIAEEYSEQYSGITAEAFRIGRKKILEGFLKRPRLFVTDIMRDKYEQNARVNITREIAFLS